MVKLSLPRFEEMRNKECFLDNILHGLGSRNSLNHLLKCIVHEPYVNMIGFVFLRNAFFIEYWNFVRSGCVISRNTTA